MPWSNPLVSVVIPYHDRPFHLDRVLSAYETQPYRDLEVMVVDDGLGSTSELEKVTKSHGVRSLRDRYRHSYGRAALCRNIGAAWADGDIFVFNDVDVIPESEAMARLVRTHMENDHLAICGIIWRIERGLEAVKNLLSNKAAELKEVSSPMEYDPLLQWSRGGSVRRSDFWWSFISGICSFRRGDLLSLLGWDPQYFGWGYEDTDLGYRILQHGLSMAFFDDILGFHIDHPDAPSERRLRSLMALRNLAYFTEKFPELKSFPLLVRRRAELEKEAGSSNKGVEDPLRANPYHLEPRRLLKHPMQYARALYRKRGPREGSISVVIPAKNREHYLRDTILSALYQTRPPRELYIVTDPSEDQTEAVARKLSRQFREVRCIANSKNRGVAESRNQGAIASTSEYVMFLDSDDLLNPWYFEKVAAILDENPKVGIAYSDYHEFGQRDRTVNLPPFETRVFLVDCIVMGPAMARRRALEEAGGYDSKQVFEDWELWMRVVEKGWIAEGVNEPLYSYRVHSGNRDVASNITRKEGEDMIYNAHRKLYEDYGIGRSEDGNWVNPPVYPPFR